jgi:hypothetical protein
MRAFVAVFMTLNVGVTYSLMLVGGPGGMNMSAKTGDIRAAMHKTVTTIIIFDLIVIFSFSLEAEWALG